MLKYSRSYTTIHIVPPCSIFNVTKHCMRFSASSLAEADNFVSISIESERQTQNNAILKREYWQQQPASETCSLPAHKQTCSCYSQLCSSPPWAPRQPWTYPPEQHQGARFAQLARKKRQQKERGANAKLRIESSKSTCVTCSSATRSKVNRDTGCPIQVRLWLLSCLTHRFCPCSDTSPPLSGRIRITTCTDWSR